MGTGIIKKGIQYLSWRCWKWLCFYTFISTNKGLVLFLEYL